MCISLGHCFCVHFFGVWFGFFSTMPRNWLAWIFRVPIWPTLYWVGCKTLTCHLHGVCCCRGSLVWSVGRSSQIAVMVMVRQLLLLQAVLQWRHQHCLCRPPAVVLNPVFSRQIHLMLLTQVMLHRLWCQLDGLLMLSLNSWPVCSCLVAAFVSVDVMDKTCKMPSWATIDVLATEIGTRTDYGVVSPMYSGEYDVLCACEMSMSVPCL